MVRWGDGEMKKINEELSHKHGVTQSKINWNSPPLGVGG